jgi:hypothetical protein
MAPGIEALRRKRIRHGLRIELHPAKRRVGDELELEVRLLLRQAGREAQRGVDDGVQVVDVLQVLLRGLGGFEERVQDVFAD